MGWVSFPMRNKTAKEWFKDEIESNGRYKVLDCATKKWNTVLYAAVKDTKTEQVFACIYLIRWSPKSEYNFSYKSMDETVGPVEIECPQRILKLLTPIDSEYANEWRKKCENYHKMNEIIRKPNTIIKLNKPVSFTNGMEFNYFKKEGNKTFAGEIQKNGVFAKFSQVRADVLYYMRSYGYEFIEA